MELDNRVNMGVQARERLLGLKNQGERTLRLIRFIEDFTIVRNQSLSLVFTASCCFLLFRLLLWCSRSDYEFEFSLAAIGLILTPAILYSTVLLVPRLWAPVLAADALAHCDEAYQLEGLAQEAHVHLDRAARGEEPLDQALLQRFFAASEPHLNRSMWQDPQTDSLSLQGWFLFSASALLVLIALSLPAPRPCRSHCDTSVGERESGCLPQNDSQIAWPTTMTSEEG